MIYTEEHVSWCSLSQLKTIYDSFILLPIDLMWSKSINSWRKSFEINRLQKLLEQKTKFTKRQQELKVHLFMADAYISLLESALAFSWILQQ